MNEKQEIYISIDIETDGPAPGINSMLALGAVAFTSRGEEIAHYYRKLHPLPGADPNPETTKWWATQPEAFEEVQKDRNDPLWTLIEFGEWCDSVQQSFNGRLIAVAWPAAFDFAYINWYCHRFLSDNPLGYSCLDIRSYAVGLAGRANYSEMSEEEIRSMAGDIKTDDLRPHFAVDDARGQGRLFIALRNKANERTMW